MAHFAELDKSNKVIRVLVIDDQYESDGENWCKDNFGGVAWKQTSYNGSIRKNYAGVGSQYDSTLDAFIPQKTFESWVLNVETCNWEPPVPCPTEPGKWMWDEETISWIDRDSQVTT